MALLLRTLSASVQSQTSSPLDFTVPNSLARPEAFPKMPTSSSRISSININGNLQKARYAVRGPIVQRSAEINEVLHSEDGQTKFPFQKLIACNIGNPHALGQKSMSFVRDVLSIVINPSLTEIAPFPKDAVTRAQKYLKGTPDIGAYSDSQGIIAVREEISEFLERRDGYPSSPASIFLTNGASDGVRFCMQTLLRDPRTGYNDGIMTPIPQYPLYSALTTLLQGHQVPYFLEEKDDWGCTASFLEESLAGAVANGISARALVVINPGNPTGQILPVKRMGEIISFCRTNNICLMADEVYQENIWEVGAEFVSFRKIAMDMKAFDGDDALQMISFHSVSKGFLGECGLRGGYFELLGIPDSVKAEIVKLASISLCSNTMGQITTGLMVNPPRLGDESHVKYNEERDAILESLSRRATRMSNALNELEGVSCSKIAGSLYAFPSITLPLKAIELAHASHLNPDDMYCSELLENTGIVVVPGSGFGQKEGSYHFRTTILPSEESLDEVISLLGDFHRGFMKKFSSDQKM